MSERNITMEEAMLNQLDHMKGKAFIYREELVEVLTYADHVGEDGDEVEIYLNNGKTIECKLPDLGDKLKQFKSAESKVCNIVSRKIESVSSVSPNVMGELRDTILESIRTLKTDPNTVNQAKQIFQGVNTMINLGKMELEYRKYIDGFNAKQMGGVKNEYKT